MAFQPYQSNRWRVVVLALSVIGIAHFAISLLIWGLYLSLSTVAAGKVFYVVVNLVMVVSFILLFSSSAILAWKRFRISAFVFLVSIILSSVLFVYDSTTKNWQLHVEQVGSSFVGSFRYFTWWWYSHE